MQIGNRIYFNQKGQIVYMTGECQGDGTARLENEVVSYIDLPYGDRTIQNAETWHIDVENKKIVVDKAREKLETEEDKLRMEKQDLENQLLLQANNNVGGIL